MALILFFLNMTDYLWIAYCVRSLIWNRMCVAHDPSLCHDTVLRAFEITIKSKVLSVFVCCVFLKYLLFKNNLLEFFPSAEELQSDHR